MPRLTYKNWTLELSQIGKPNKLTHEVNGVTRAYYFDEVKSLSGHRLKLSYEGDYTTNVFRHEVGREIYEKLRGCE